VLIAAMESSLTCRDRLQSRWPNSPEPVYVGGNYANVRNEAP
jgi:hypothetical protein